MFFFCSLLVLKNLRCFEDYKIQIDGAIQAIYLARIKFCSPSTFDISTEITNLRAFGMQKIFEIEIIDVEKVVELRYDRSKWIQRMEIRKMVITLRKKYIKSAHAISNSRYFLRCVQYIFLTDRFVLVHSLCKIIGAYLKRRIQNDARLFSMRPFALSLVMKRMSMIVMHFFFYFILT